MVDGSSPGGSDATSLADRPEFFERLVRQTSDAVVVFDRDGEVRFANAAVASLLGRDPLDVVGSHVDTLVPDRYAGWLGGVVETSLETGERTFDWNGVEFPFVCEDGSEVAVSLTLADHDWEGTTVFSVVARDVSDHVDRREALREALDRREHTTERFVEAVEEPLRDAAEALSLARDHGGDVGPAAASTPAGAGRDRDEDADPLTTVADAHARIETLVAEWLVAGNDPAASDGDADGVTLTETTVVSLSDIAADAWETVGRDDAMLQIDALGSVEADPALLRDCLADLFGTVVRHGRTGVTVHVGPLSNGFYVATEGSDVPGAVREAVVDGDDTGEGRGDRVHAVAEAHGWTAAATGGDGDGVRFEFRTRDGNR
jgi:PAS domain S-box-containing protein